MNICNTTTQDAKVKPQSDLEYETCLNKALETFSQPNPVSIKSAALSHGVSKTTLGNIFFQSGKPLKKAHVSQKLVTEEEEIELVKWVVSITGRDGAGLLRMALPRLRPGAKVLPLLPAPPYMGHHMGDGTGWGFSFHC